MYILVHWLLALLDKVPDEAGSDTRIFDGRSLFLQWHQALVVLEFAAWE
jgi:hypothetical protein